MPFRSERQRRYLYANEPELAARWEKTYGSKGLPETAPRKDRRLEVIRRRAPRTPR